MTDQEQRTEFALSLKSCAGAVYARRSRATPVELQAARLLEVLARTAAAEGGTLHPELRQAAERMAAGLDEVVGRPGAGDARALTALVGLYTETAPGHPTPEVLADLDAATVVLARYVTERLGPEGAPRPYPVTALASATAAIGELVATLVQRMEWVADGVHGHQALPSRVPGALRHPDPDVDPGGAAAQGERWLRFCADEMGLLPEPLGKAVLALAPLTHLPAPRLDP